MQKVADPKDSRLTIKQRQAISLLASGNTYEEAAMMMRCGVHNVYNHIDNAKRNCAVATLAQLVAVCAYEGEIVQEGIDHFITCDEALGVITYSYLELT